jgi:hypothetical protein
MAAFFWDSNGAPSPIDASAQHRDDASNYSSMVPLGVHPDVSLERAKARHQVVRTILAVAVDPGARTRVFGNLISAAEA